ncbi:hypothetical protein IFM89_030745 [Coptis chinensis]|uniref:HTH TFE/IIEalpha-type domain-containing protein n=1 Tax=Coptis chinensis TaxID=261450 RepID=A0A835MDV7_9MAGN|nr:hypothetical protein IFM89_030745 [Coptis chinensis]
MKEGEDKLKLHTHSYCCLDYAQIYDVVRYRMHRMKKKLKDELENRNTVQEYICPNCNRRYTALDALRLISPNDEYFHCENYDTVLVAASDKLAADEIGDGDDNARSRRLEKLKDILQKMDVQLKPLMEQLARIKDLPAPVLPNMEVSKHGKLELVLLPVQMGILVPMIHQNLLRDKVMVEHQCHTLVRRRYYYYYFVQHVEVALSGVKEEDVKPDTGTTSRRVLPPWMIKQGMLLTNEQRGEVKRESKMDSSSGPIDRSDDKKPNNREKATKIVYDEYVKAYYAALLKRQEEERSFEEAGSSLAQALFHMMPHEAPLDRQVGMKSKRGDEESGDDVEWEEASTAAVHLCQTISAFLIFPSLRWCDLMDAFSS